MKTRGIHKGNNFGYKHGLSHDGITKSYMNAKYRCTNPNSSQYSSYGGRGIEFRFKSVKELHDEIGDKPKGMSIDRINNDGHYEKGNVRWATRKEQARNRRNTICSDSEVYLLRLINKATGKGSSPLAKTFNIKESTMKGLLYYKDRYSDLNIR